MNSQSSTMHPPHPATDREYLIQIYACLNSIKKDIATLVACVEAHEKDIRELQPIKKDTSELTAAVAMHDKDIRSLQLWQANMMGKAAGLGAVAGVVSGVIVGIVVKLVG